MLRLFAIYNDLCTAITLVHFSQIKDLEINGMGDGTYLSVTFSKEFLSVCASACYFPVEYGRNASFEYQHKPFAAAVCQEVTGVL